jgi:hypothetical protein
VGTLVLVGGSIASNYGNGGHAWELLSWALGFRRLGYDILIVDPLRRDRCVYPDGLEPKYENSLNVDYAKGVARGFGLEGSYAVVGDAGEALFGPNRNDLLDLASDAEMLVNMAGTLQLESLKRRCRLKVYVDGDPGLTQLWLASGNAVPRLAGHDLHFTIGENIGTSASSIPTVGISWLHTRQPVLLHEWPVTDGADSARFTTLATLRGTGPHGRLETLGRDPGHKADELAKVIELPQRVPMSFELAIKLWAADPADVRFLERYGWRVVNAASVAFGPDGFRHYIEESGAEFSVAKGIYAETCSGWFSDRTTRYLASGKPALVQDTGFGRSIPTGEGLLAFRTLPGAIEGATRIAEEYQRHSRAARELAEQYFDSDKVLTRFLEDVDSHR